MFEFNAQEETKFSEQYSAKFDEIAFWDSVKRILHNKIKQEQLKQTVYNLFRFSQCWGPYEDIPFVSNSVVGNMEYVKKHISQVSLTIKLAAFIKSMDLKICELLLKSGVDVDGCVGRASPYMERDLISLHLYNALWESCEKGNFSKTSWLIKKGASAKWGKLNERGFRTPPVFAAIKADSPKCLNLLLQTGCFKRLPTLLNFAVKNGKFNTAKLLVNRFKVKWAGETLRLAISSRNPKLVEFFLQKGAPVTKNLLFYCVEEADENIVQILLKHSTLDVNIKNSQGQTLLAAAAKLFDRKMCAILLQRGADITLTDKTGKNIFDYIESTQRDDEYKRAFINFLKEQSNKPKE